MPDFFDRLLARSVPAYDGGVVPVRPRVPGQFERAAPLPELAELPAAPAGTTREPAPPSVVPQPVRPAASPVPPPDAAPQPGPAPVRIVERHAERVTELVRETVGV